MTGSGIYTQKEIADLKAENESLQIKIRKNEERIQELVRNCDHSRTHTESVVYGELEICSLCGTILEKNF